MFGFGSKRHEAIAHHFKDGKKIIVDGEEVERLIIDGEDIMSDVMKKQVGGDHYKKHTIQPWDIIDEYDLDYYEGNALKYLLRDKSDTDRGKRKEDLQKAIHYIEKKLTEWEEHPNQSHMEIFEGTSEALNNL